MLFLSYLLPSRWCPTTWRLLRLVGCLLGVTVLFANRAWALDAHQLALIINTADPASVETGAYYRQKRDIPAANVIEVAFPYEAGALAREEFERVFAEVQKKLPTAIQAFALAWTRPWRAGCMGITSAFAFGYDEAFCSATCGPTRASKYFNGGHGVAEYLPMPRPAMLLAGESFAEVRRLIDRGVAADFSYPKGTVYLVRTEDLARNVRAALFDDSTRLVAGLRFDIVAVAKASQRDDVVGYFTGAVNVPAIPTLTFLPGAPADHLTSIGGQLLNNNSQMSALEWLKGGATASYGTVVEPCNHLGKFPHPGILMGNYAQGDTLIEAYWKSVAWPGEGVFIGEPLARPYGTRTVQDAQGWWVESHSAVARRAVVETSASVLGPFRWVAVIDLPAGYRKQRLTGLTASAVRVR